MTPAGPRTPMTTPSPGSSPASGGEDRPLRLAVYGYIEETAGSLAGANHLLLEHLLAAGHEIDLYAVRGWVEPKDFRAYPNYHYRGYWLPSVELAWKLPELLHLGPLNALLRKAIGLQTALLYNRAMQRELQRRDRVQRYDALLTLGLLSPFRVTTIPQISWTQGTPNGEWEYARRRPGQLIGQSNRLFYWGMGLWYWWKGRQHRELIPYSRLIIGGSRWAMDSWLTLGARPEQLRALPYPFDLHRFQPAERPPDSGRRPLRLLHLGRVVPRKRFDLLLESFQLFRQAEPDAELLVVGTFDYAVKARELLDDPVLRQNVRWVPRMTREEVAQLLREVDILVQPSENENFGSAVAEALACGIPVLVGPSNGTRDFVHSDLMVFEDYTPESICGKLQALAAAWRSRRAELTRQTRAWAEQQFDVAHVADQLLAMVREIMREPAQGTAVPRHSLTDPRR